MTPIPSLTRNKEIVRRFLIETHSGQLDCINELVAADIITHGFPGRCPDSRESYREFFKGLGAAFSDAGFDIHDMVEENDRVAVRFTVRGIHTGDYLGVSATGHPVDFTGMVLYRLRDGMIAETWLYPDNVTLMRQLGVLPEPQVA